MNPALDIEQKLTMDGKGQLEKNLLACFLQLWKLEIINLLRNFPTFEEVRIISSSFIWTKQPVAMMFLDN